MCLSNCSNGDWSFESYTTSPEPMHFLSVYFFAILGNPRPKPMVCHRPKPVENCNHDPQCTRQASCQGKSRRGAKHGAFEPIRCPQLPKCKKNVNCQQMRHRQLGSTLPAQLAKQRRKLPPRKPVTQPIRKARSSKVRTLKANKGEKVLLSPGSGVQTDNPAGSLMVGDEAPPRANELQIHRMSRTPRSPTGHPRHPLRWTRGTLRRLGSAT